MDIEAPAKGPVTVRYWLALGGGRFGGGGVRDDSYVQVSGPATYLYLVDRKKEDCTVTFDVPHSWPVMVGLDEISVPGTVRGLYGKGEAAGDLHSFKAPTYDVLADNPMSTGDILVDHYTLRGKDHYVVLEGTAKSQVNRAKLLKDCRFVSAAETDFWGGAPYHKYVWHFAVRPGADGAGGLEHLSSTQISLAAGEGPLAQSVLSHEYFHLWNVKRIRSKVLGPFDYTQLPKTGALWWLEGVTDYYAWLLPYRYGEWDRPMFFNGIVRNMVAIQNNPARLTVCANEASLRVGDANGGRGNSNGYQISYYNLGWLCGLCLDTEIRAQTNGKHSLDDVAHALFDMCKNDQPGFEEDEIRKQCIRFGGPSLGPFYDKVVMTPGELPIADQLAKMGVKLEAGDQTYADLGFTVPTGGGPGGGGSGGPNGAATAPTGPRINAVRGASAGKLMPGDLVKSINGNNLDGKSLLEAATIIRSVQDNAKVDVPVTLEVVRNGQTIYFLVNPAAAKRKTIRVAIDPNASPAARALGEQWLATKTPEVQ